MNMNVFVYGFISIILSILFYFISYELGNKEEVANVKFETGYYHPHTECVEWRGCLPLFVEIDALGYLFYKKEKYELDKLARVLKHDAVRYEKNLIVLSVDSTIHMQKVLSVSEYLTAKVKPQRLNWRTIENEI